MSGGMVKIPQPEPMEPVDHGIANEDRSPRAQGAAFECPHCGVYATQQWSIAYKSRGGGSFGQIGPWVVGTCGACSDQSLWHGDVMVHPRIRLGPPPSADMPEKVRTLYEEAREVCGISRKSAAALLRLALQVLVDDLDKGSGSINDKIGRLVRQGLDPQVQQAMDVVRVVGNNAVHPGQIDLDGDENLLPALLGLVNLIVEQMITRPKHVGQLFGSLPASAQAAIATRDGNI